MVSVQKKCFAGNLPRDCRVSELEDLFDKHGKIKTKDFLKTRTLFEQDRERVLIIRVDVRLGMLSSF